MSQILTINTGSSSLKVGVYEDGRGEAMVLSGEVARIGEAAGRLRLSDASGKLLLDREGAFADHGAALEGVLGWLKSERSDLAVGAVGHRVVQGGPHHCEPERITPELITALKDLVPIAPDHLPQAIRTIEVAARANPNLPQVACFDTAFHRHMPRVARMYPLPRRLCAPEGRDVKDSGAGGLVRSGFHGLSYESILHQLGTIAPAEASGRVIIAHLGSGASMAAVRGGIGIDTTMGFTPAGGLMMGTRPGDLDPGVMLYLMFQPPPGMRPAALGKMINHESGLLGVSGISGDMRSLLDQESNEAHAAEAIALFCYLARKQLGALTTPLGGLDTLIFTGGIGMRSAPIRARICEGLGYLGIRIDPERNDARAPVISPEAAPTTVRVLRTNENLMIARHTRELLTNTVGTHFDRS
ncbi:acetate/propionate family kinase [soil metagenome]